MSHNFRWELFVIVTDMNLAIFIIMSWKVGSSPHFFVICWHKMHLICLVQLQGVTPFSSYYITLRNPAHWLYTHQDQMAIDVYACLQVCIDKDIHLIANYYHHACCSVADVFHRCKNDELDRCRWQCHRLRFICSGWHVRRTEKKKKKRDTRQQVCYRWKSRRWLNK